MQFICRIGMPDGRVVEEVHQARDEASLRSDLERRGLHIFEAHPRGFSFSRLLPQGARSGKMVATRDLLIFNQELAALLRAGLPLLQAVELMLERMRPGTFRTVLLDVRDRIKSGEELSEAFEAHGELFPRLYPATLKAGEKSGELEGVLRRFIRYLKLVTEARRRLFSALVYPAILVSLSVVMILVLSILVVPKFKEFFSTLGVELPLLTKMTVGFSLFLVNYWVPLLAALLIGFVLFSRWKATALGAVALDHFKLRIPLIGGTLHRFALSEFSRSLSTLLSGGIPLVSAFEISSRAVGNRYIRKALEPTIDRVREGQAFHAALEQSGVYLPLGIELVKVGEATGGLDEMLSTISDFFDEEIETRLGRLLSMIEPLMLIFLGVMVSLILLSIYLPLFNSLSNSQY